MKKFILFLFILTTFVIAQQPLNPVSLRYYIENIQFAKFHSDSINANQVVTDTLDVDTLYSQKAEIDTLDVDTLYSQKAEIDTLFVDTLAVNNFGTDSLWANWAQILKLTDGTATLEGGDLTGLDSLQVAKVGAYTLYGKLTAGAIEIEGSNFDVNGGAVDGTPIGANSASTGKFSTLALADNTAAKLLIGSGTTYVPKAMSGDATIDANGVITLIPSLTGWRALAQGVSWNQSTDTYTRIGSLSGLAASASPGDAALPVQSEMKRCLLNDNGTVNYYLDSDNSMMKEFTSIPYSDSINYVNGDTIIVTGATFSTTADTGMWVHNVDSTLYAMIIGMCSNDTLILSDSIFVVGDSLNQYNAILNGDDGQVVVEIPKFYIKHDLASTTHSWYVSLYHLPGFEIHPAFLKDGQVVDYRYIGAFEAIGYDNGTSAYVNSTGVAATNWAGGAINTAADKLGSVAGYIPMTDETRAEFRSVARNVGTGWEQMDAFLYGAVQILYLVEYADFNSQACIGTGNTSYDAWNFGNCVGYTGFSLPDGNATNASNTAEDALAGASDDNDGIAIREYMSYRGIENIFGSVWDFVDGWNVNDYKSYVSYLDNYADDTSTDYVYQGTMTSTSGAYVTNILDYDFMILPSAASGGSATTYICDYYYIASGWRVVLAGGYAAGGAPAGVFCVSSAYDSSADAASIGARLCY